MHICARTTFTALASTTLKADVNYAVAAVGYEHGATALSLTLAVAADLWQPPLCRLAEWLRLGGGIDAHAECAALLLEAGATADPAADRGAATAALAAAAAAAGMDHVLKWLLVLPPLCALPGATERAPLHTVSGSWADLATALAGVSCLLRLNGHCLGGDVDSGSGPTSQAELLRLWCRAGGRLGGAASCVARLLAAQLRGAARRGVEWRGGRRAEAVSCDVAVAKVCEAADGVAEVPEVTATAAWPASRFAGRTPLMLCAQLGMSVAVRRLLRSAEPSSSRLVDTPLKAADDPYW